MAVWRSLLRATGFYDIVGPDDYYRVCLLELGVYVFHVVELFVGDVGFGKEDVHVAGHPAGYGVDAELDLFAFGLQRLHELVDGVLGLGGGETVARHDHDGLRLVFEK